MRAAGVFVAVLCVVTVATHQYWLLPAGLALGAVGVALTSR